LRTDGMREQAMWGGPPGPRPTPTSASVSPVMAGPDQGVRRGRRRPPHRAKTATALRYSQDQPKYIPLRPSDFFADGRSARPLPEGTVARGQLRADKVFFTGKNGDEFVDRIPFPVTRAVLDRGQERFNIYCSPCHGRLGNGLGMIVRRGFKRPPSYHIDRLRQIQIGYFYDIISNGFGAMADYSAQVAPRDRWAIAAYIRVLQYSQMASVNDVPTEHRQELGDAANSAVEKKTPQ
jgi:Cytochrome C oxidase, cbb3-type, subunit III